MKTRVCLSVIIALTVICLAAAVYAASEISKSPVCYVTVEGVKQGKLKGESMYGAQGPRIDSFRYAYLLTAGGGAAVTKAQQGIVVITKVMGGASPQLFQAMVTGETLKSVTIEFVKSGGSGQKYHTVRLLNARVTAVRQFTEGNTVYEDVSFAYQKIETINHVANTSASN